MYNVIKYFVIGSDKVEKPLLTIEAQIEKLKEKGVTFNFCSIEDAKEFLKNHNNYFRITSYRKNYDKFPRGENEGKYRYLDFQYLQELSTIDMHLRYMIIKMCLDIEHCLKLDLLRKAEEKYDDGFCCVDAFFKEEGNERIKQDIYYKRNSNYCNDLIKSYFVFDEEKQTISDYSKCRLWVLLEVLTFGQFVNFYNYFHNYYGIRNKYSGNINTVKSLRNACAHNNCILANLRPDNSCLPDANITKFVSKNTEIGREAREKNLSKRTLFEMVTLLFVYDSFVSNDLKKHRIQELKELVDIRMKKHSEYFSNQQMLIASYDFLKKVIDIL